MNDTSLATPESGSDSARASGKTRRAHAIRFSASEWVSVEGAMIARGMNDAEFVRHAPFSLASAQFGDT